VPPPSCPNHHDQHRPDLSDGGHLRVRCFLQGAPPNAGAPCCRPASLLLRRLCLPPSSRPPNGSCRNPAALPLLCLLFVQPPLPPPPLPAIPLHLHRPPLLLLPSSHHPVSRRGTTTSRRRALRLVAAMVPPGAHPRPRGEQADQGHAAGAGAGALEGRGRGRQEKGRRAVALLPRPVPAPPGPLVGGAGRRQNGPLAVRVPRVGV
jgi:hypothetical protein